MHSRTFIYFEACYNLAYNLLIEQISNKPYSFKYGCNNLLHFIIFKIKLSRNCFNTNMFTNISLHFCKVLAPLMLQTVRRHKHGSSDHKGTIRGMSALSWIVNKELIHLLLSAHFKTISQYWSQSFAAHSVFIRSRTEFQRTLRIKMKMQLIVVWWKSICFAINKY
jgi:hypothetical protein